MKRFAALFAELDTTTATNAKVAALARYLATTPPADAAWGVYFLAGGKPRQVVASRVLWTLACERAGIDDWLFEESYQAVGDFAETVALVLPPPSRYSDLGLAQWVEERVLPLRGADPATQARRVAQFWDELDGQGRFLFNKLIGGDFRVGVSRLLVQRALAQAFAVDPKWIAQRMMGYTDIGAMPTPARFAALTAGTPDAGGERGQPYPFFLAAPLDAPDPAGRLGEPSDWIVEWKYDGIRAQVVKREGATWIWSRGEELVTERFPEIVAAASTLPDGTVLDGEILVWKEDRVAPFHLLQQRIGRKSLTRTVLRDAPAAFIAYDVLEWQCADIRDLPLHERRALLEAVVAAHPALRLSPLESRADWAALAALRRESRERGVEGFMLKHRQSRYGIGRRKQDDLPGGTWWKWKIDPYRVDAVLVYAQPGHGRRASLYTDYTFAVWSRAPRDAAEAQDALAATAQAIAGEPDALQLVAFAKAYSGLTDEEILEIDRIVRRTTVEKFGPVRSVRPTLVFELGFEGINRSGRHKSGVAVRFPRMLRVRRDKPVHEADTLPSLLALLAADNSPSESR